MLMMARPVEKEGQLEQRCGTWPRVSWRPRRAVLLNGVLYITTSSSSSSSRRADRVDVQTCEVAALGCGDEGEERARRFCLDDGRHVIHLRASTRPLRDAWVSSLRAHKAYFRALLSPDVANNSIDINNIDINNVSGKGLVASLSNGTEEGQFYDAEEVLSVASSDTEEISDAFTSTSTTSQQQQHYHQQQQRHAHALSELLRLQRTLSSASTSSSSSSASPPSSSSWRGFASLEGAVALAAHSIAVGMTERAALANRLALSEGELARAQQEIASLKRQLDVQVQQVQHDAPHNSTTDTVNTTPEDTLDSTCATDTTLAKGVLISKLFKQRRARLPYVAKRPRGTVWSILKDNLGKDLWKISLPISFHEPLSLLQRNMEDLEYAYLLDEAAHESDPSRRLLLLAAFSVSFYSSMEQRLEKPFNPLLGETYEFEEPERGLRFIAEQVSHHPPIAAAHCETDFWTWDTTIGFKTAFWGQSLEVSPVGAVRVSLRRHGYRADVNGNGVDGHDDDGVRWARYRWEKAISCIHNVVVGTMWLQHYGNVVIKGADQDDGHVARVSLHKGPPSSDKFARVTGSVTDAAGHVAREIAGRWNDELHEIAQDGAELPVWKKAPDPECPRARSHRMTQFSISLNTEDESVASTDSRHRPDMRALDNGDYAKGETEKRRLEEKQRARARSGQSVAPRWFAIDERTGEWTYQGGYFEAKREGFKGLTDPNLF